MPVDQELSALASVASLLPTDIIYLVRDPGGVAEADHKAAVSVLDARYPGAVISVFGRTGAVVAVSGDYSAGQISGLGSAALAAVGDFATAAQGALAATALQAAAIGVTVQAYDAGLASIAALTTAADKMIYTTALDTYAVTDLTAFGRSLIDDANEATARTTLGLVAGGAGDIWVEKAGDTMTGQLFIDGGSDQIQQRIQAAAAQTVNLMTWEIDGGVVKTLVDSTGYGWRVGDIVDRGSISIGAQAVNNNFGLRIDRRVSAPTTSLFGVSGEMSTSGAISGSISTVAGLSFSGRGNHTSGTLSNLYGIDILARNNNTGIVTTMYGLRIQTPESTGGGTVGQVYGLRIMDQIVGTSQPYAIQTNAGMVIFNDGGDSTSEFRVEGDTDQFLINTDPANNRVGIGDATPDAKLDVVQTSTTGAIPVLNLEQLDIDQPFVELITTIGTGNAIEAIGAKTLTTTHFVMVKIPGGLTRYFPIGTIA